MATSGSERIPKELLRETVLPVILGNGFSAHRLALRLRLRYGMSSLLCGTNAGALDHISPYSGFWELISENDGRFLSEQLIDLADRNDGCLLVLVFLYDTQRSLLAPYQAELESRFILTEPHRLLEPDAPTVLSFGKALEL